MKQNVGHLGFPNCHSGRFDEIRVKCHVCITICTSISIICPSKSDRRRYLFTLNAFPSPPASKETLHAKFEQYDPDGTGYVKPAEAVYIMSQEFRGLPETCIQSMVRRYDRDHNGMVDFGEIIEFYACLKAK